MTITTQTLKARPSGERKIFVNLPAMTVCYLLSWLQVSSRTNWLHLSSVCVSSVGVALSRGHGKSFFRGNVSVEAGMLVQLSFIRKPSKIPCLFEEGLLNCAPSWAGIAEALLTCVFQGSVIWNSQMSPWQMNGNAGVMEMGIHALCRLLLSVHRACDVTCDAPPFGPQDLLQHRGAARAPSPHPNPSHQALHDRPQAAPQMYQTRDEYVRLHGASFTCLFVCFKLTLWL